VIDVGDDGEIARQFCGHSVGGEGTVVWGTGCVARGRGGGKLEIGGRLG
jgi:hypothetical protein